MDDIASLGLRIDAAQADNASVALDKMAAAGGRAEKAANKLTTAERGVEKATGAAADAAMDAVRAAQALAGEQEAVIKTANRLNAAHGSAVASSKSLQQASLNLGRQFADVGTSLAGGMNPLMVLVQQGPQVTDIFAQLKTQGIGAGAAFSAMGASLAPALPLILGIGAAVGAAAAAFAVFEQAVDKDTKHATTWGDTWNATIHVIGKNIMDGPIGDGLKWLGATFAKVMDGLVDGVTGFYDSTVGFFMAAYQTVVANWTNLPAALGAIMQGAVNKMLDGVEFLINGVIKGLNWIREKAGLQALADIDLPRLQVANAKVAGDFSRAWVVAAAAAKKAREGFASDVSADADRQYEKRQKDKAKATKSAAEEVAKLNDKVVSFTDAIIRESDAVKAVNDNVKTMGDLLGDVRIPNALENMIAALEQARSQSDAVARSVDDIFYSIRGNDWAGAFSGLLTAITSVKKAFETAKASGDKLGMINAVGSAAMAAGNLVGGSAGKGISGAASGAMTGASIGSIIPGVGTAVGAVVGGLLGGISSLFGSSKAKKQARAEAEAQRLAQEQARLQEVANQKRSIELQLLEAQGKSVEALALRREDELAALAKLDPSLVEYQRQLYAATDAADAAAKAQEDAAEAAVKAAKIAQKAADVAAAISEANIVLMEAQGNVEGALAARRKQQLTGMAPMLAAITTQIFAAQDLAAANENLAQVQAEAAQKVDEARSALSSAYEREASGYKAARERFKSLGETISSTLKELMSGSASGLSPEARYQSTRAEFERVAALAKTGNEKALADLPAAAQAFRDASAEYLGGSAEFFGDRDLIANALKAAESVAIEQVNLQDQQLAKLDAQIGALLTVNASVLTVTQAIANLNDAIAAQSAAIFAANARVTVAQTAVTQAQVATDAVAKETVANLPNWSSYLINNPDIAAEFARQTTENLDFIGVKTGADFAQWHYNKYGQGEGRKPFAAGGIMDRPISLGESGIGGEAGPEGILPLTNVGGRMGVYARLPNDDRETRQELVNVMREVLFELRADKAQRGAIGKATLDRFEALNDGINGVKKAVQAA